MGLTRMIHYATTLLKIGGVRAFLLQLKRQIYSRDTLFGLEKTLANNGAKVKSQCPYILEKASRLDINEMAILAKTESRQSAHELLERKWFYDSGFQDCYIARTIDTGEPCGIAWLVSSDNDAALQDFSRRLPALEKDEILLENCYTFEKYRGQGIMPAMVYELQETARKRGFRRLVTHVRRGNAASLRVFEKLKFTRVGKVSELKLLFRTKRKHG